jgi:four helix bundle protein
MMHNFKELSVWQKARELNKQIYLLTKKFPREERYAITQQIQRSCVSIASNIAE